MRLDDIDVVVWDCEVFSHDWLVVFKHLPDGEVSSFWNDPEGVSEYFDSHSGSVFAGFNSKHYDQYIAKAIEAGCSPEEVKEVNDSIIGSDEPPWEHPYLAVAKRKLWFHGTDLMDDMMKGTSLKSIEGHLGMSIEESSVPFDIDRPLTDEEREEVERYCLHDVEATEVLLGMRREYLETKLHLAELADIDPYKALGMTNAKLTAAVLKASSVEYDDERDYAVPSNLLVEYVPREALDFFAKIHDENVSDDELWSMKCDLVVGGCPVTLGFGGIHGAVPCYREEA